MKNKNTEPPTTASATLPASSAPRPTSDQSGIATATVTVTVTVADHPGRVEWNDSTGRTRQAIASKKVLDHELYAVPPTRTGNRYPGQRNYHGIGWFSNTGQQLWLESLTERTALLWLDFSYDIVSISSQPMKMFFPDGTVHFPDFLALHSDGRQVVYNVKPARFITEKVTKQFANAAELCARVGWSHEVITTFEPELIANIECLAHYRNPMFRPSTETHDQLSRILTRSLPVIEAATAMTTAPANTAISTLYHLAWVGEIQLDLSRPLSNSTVIRKAHHAHA
jgi:hypothetical protein